MLRLLSVIAICAGLFCFAQSNAQVPLTGAGPSGPIASAYQGLGDAVTGAYGYWSAARCYNNAFSGSIADITDASTGSTTGTRLQCAPGNVITAVVSASACTFVTGNACSALATTCAVSCNVQTAYDQSGASNCSGACNLPQPTNGNRPLLVLSDYNGLSCMRFASGSSQVLGTQASASTNPAEPFTISAVAKVTAASGGAGIFTGNGAPSTLGFNSTTSVVLSNSGTQLAKTITASVLHAIQGTQAAGAAASSLYVDGSNTASTSTVGSNGLNATGWYIGRDYYGNYISADICEVAVYSGFSAGNQTAANANQHGTNGYNF